MPRESGAGSILCDPGGAGCLALCDPWVARCFYYMKLCNELHVCMLVFTLEVLKTFSMVHFTGVCIYVCMCSIKHLECSSVLRVVVLFSIILTWRYYCTTIFRRVYSCSRGYCLGACFVLLVSIRVVGNSSVTLEHVVKFLLGSYHVTQVCL